MNKDKIVAVGTGSWQLAGGVGRGRWQLARLVGKGDWQLAGRKRRVKEDRLTSKVVTPEGSNLNSQGFKPLEK